MVTDRMLIKIVRAYYEAGLTQQEIADKYGLSRIKVSRLLAKALRERVVQIKINAPIRKYAALEQHLELKYGLKDVLVVECKTDHPDEIIKSVGIAAADYLNTILQGNEIIGLSWGQTLLKMVDALSPYRLPDLQVVQMLGGLGEPEAAFHGADLTLRMAQNFSTKPRLIHAPGIVRTKEICRELIHDIQVRSTLELAAQADIAVVGIGLFGPGSHLLKNKNILSREDIDLLTSLNVVGDISFRFFNDQGKYVSSEIDERIVGLTAEQVGKIPRIIGIAGGPNKLKTIHAALKGRLIHVMITDNDTALKLIAEKSI
jgi:DNA-binding transcriptional regulator LsrR (DeoR family)